MSADLPSDDLVGIGAPDPVGIDARMMLGELRAEMFGAGEPAKVGRFDLLRLLGRGAFGSVYLANDVDLQREVAVKVLTTGGSDEQLRARFVREAQALAKLKHPNVLTIHDVGVEGDRVYIAMEYVEAGTLSTWCAQHQPGSRARFVEVLRFAVAAGRGLAAAHDAGIVHRDVKPANILVGSDGRPRLADFGLARAVIVGHDTWDTETDGGASKSASSTSLTNTGDVLGTPAYMAPEQFAGHSDKASDQWSLCATFWEAAYGERPFRGRTALELSRAVERVPESPPSQRSEVPTWWRDILMRGLSPDPADRWPSVADLVAALDGAAARQRRRTVMLSVSAVAAVGVGVFGWQRYAVAQRRATCEQEAAAITNVWNDARRDALQAGLEQADVSYADSTFARAAPALQAYADHWAEDYEALCLATEVERTRSADLWAASARCLRERKEQLASLLEVVVDEPSRDVANQTIAAVSNLPLVQACSDDARLLRVHSTDIDPADAELRQRLRRARALRSAHAFEAGRALAETLAEDTVEHPNQRLRSEILLAQGALESGSGEPKRARETLGRAFDLAMAAGEDDVAFTAASLLVSVAGLGLTELEPALLWGRVAEGLRVRFAGPDDLSAAKLAGYLGHVYGEHGQFEKATAAYARALSIRSDILGPEHPEVGRIHSSIGNVLRAQGKNDEAEQAQLRSLGILERALGEDHPGIALALNNLANVYRSQTRYDEAVAIHERTVALRKKALRPDHPDLAQSYVNLAHLFYLQGKYDEAERAAKDSLAIVERSLGAGHVHGATANEKLGMIFHRRGRYEEAEQAFSKALAAREAELGPDHPVVGRTLSSIAITYFFLQRFEDAERALNRAIAIQEAKHGPGHPDVAAALNSLGNVYKQWERYDDAEATFSRALSILEKSLGPDHVNTASMHNNLASLAARDGRHGEAELAYTKAIELREAKLGAEHPALLNPLQGRSKARLELERADEAVEDAKRAVKIADEVDRNPIELADARQHLAHALWAVGEDRERARDLMAQALEAYRAAGERFAPDVAETERWLTEHRL